MSQDTTLNAIQLTNRDRSESPSKSCVIVVRTYNVVRSKMPKKKNSSSGTSTAVYCLQSDGWLKKKKEIVEGGPLWSLVVSEKKRMLIPKY